MRSNYKLRMQTSLATFYGGTNPVPVKILLMLTRPRKVRTNRRAGHSPTADQLLAVELVDEPRKGGLLLLANCV